MNSLLPVTKFFAQMFNPIIAIGLALYSFVQWISRTMTGQEVSMGQLRAAYETLKTATASSVFGQFPAPIQGAVAFVNYVFPVTEGLILLGLLSTVYVLCVAFRIVKSWIPSVA